MHYKKSYSSNQCIHNDIVKLVSRSTSVITQVIAQQGVVYLQHSHSTAS